jgi:acid phosphatase family membrane protein YuiD
VIEGIDFAAFLHATPFWVGVLAAVTAQAIKVVSFLVVEKRVNYRRFVQTDGSPNMHAAAMSAMTLYIGFADGVGSIVFAVSLCLTTLVTVDAWNVKGAHSRQQEAILLILERWGEPDGGWARGRQALSYTPMDVLSGTALGIVITLLCL